MTTYEQFCWELSHNGHGKWSNGEETAEVISYGSYATVTIESANEYWPGEFDAIHYSVAYDYNRRLPVFALSTIGRHFSQGELLARINLRNYWSDCGPGETFTSKMLLAAYSAITHG